MTTQTISTSRVITIYIGLAMTVFLPVFQPSRLGELVVDLPPLQAHEVFWWALSAIVLLYVVLVERLPLSSIGLRRPTWGTLGAVLAGAVLMLGASIVIGLILAKLGLAINRAALDKLLAQPWWFRLLLVTRAGVVEELLLRGYGMERIRELTGSRFVAALVTLAAFTLAHLSYWGVAQLVVAGVAGLVLTLLYLWRRELIANMTVHFITDAVGLLLQP